MSQQKPWSIEQQAELIESLIRRCTMGDGSVAAETHMTMRADDIHALRALATRLKRMAPYEDKIKKMVVGR